MKKLIVANWKMYLNQIEASKLASDLSKIELDNKNEIIICPPSIHLSTLAKIFSNSQIKLGGQDCSHLSSDFGPYTGEISAKMLEDLGAKYCLVGHSERRTQFGESNAQIKDKISFLHQNNLTAILCIGESLTEKNNNLSLDVLKKQILESIPESFNEENLIIAYEPIWAIGTGISASINEIQNIVINLKEFITKEIEKKIKIVYGGSVNLNNVKEILSIPDLSGVLIGSASLNFDEFTRILELGR